MTSKLERQWWFSLPVVALSVLLTVWLMDSAGMPHAANFAQSVLYAVCFVGFQRGVSFAGFLLVLCFAPSNALLERAS